MGCCGRVAPALLIHVNLLLCLVAGACLATAARLKWDPSTYVGIRELFPEEYAVAGGALCGAGGALLALAHLAVAALALRARRPTEARALLRAYAALQTALACAALGWAAWTGARLAAWLRSERAAHIADLMELRNYLRPFLAYLARYHPLPDHLNDLMQEAEEDAPRNLYLAAAAALLTALLQPVAALLALVCAAEAGVKTGAEGKATSPPPPADSTSMSSTDSENAPLKTAYRNGRLVIV